MGQSRHVVTALRMAVGVGLVGALGVGIGAGPAAATAATGGATTVGAAPLVVIGVPGLAWSDITPAAAPTMFGAVPAADVASMSVRAVRTLVCPIDGWLTVGAGRRSADVQGDTCRDLPRPGTAPVGRSTDEAAPAVTDLPDGARPVTAGDWTRLAVGPDDARYDADPGLLGGTLAQARTCAVAVGPGAALTLATPTGHVARYLDSPADLTSASLDTEAGGCPLAVVDAGWVDEPRGAASRSSTVAAVDATIARLVAALPSSTRIIVAGIADAGPTARTGAAPAQHVRGLRVALDTTVGAMQNPTGTGHWLASRSTRWDSLVQTTDLTSTIIAHLGLERPLRMTGTAWSADQPHPADAATTVDNLAALNRGAVIFRAQYSVFYPFLAYITAAVFAATLLVIHRRRGRPGPDLTLTRVVAYAAATLPVASFLSNLTRWWERAHPEAVLWGSTAAFAAALAAVAAFGPWRRRPEGPSLLIAGVTAAVLAVDVATGSRLQHMSPMGVSPLDGGRYYGLGNIPFALFAVAVLTSAAGVAAALGRRGAPPRVQGLVVLFIGMTGALIDGAPAAGADVGGLLALTPGAVLLAMLAAGIRLTWRRLLMVGAATGLVFVVMGMIDYLQPADQRSHLGTFIQSVFDGTAGTTLRRKAHAAIGTLDEFYSWLAPVAYWAAVRLVLRPEPRRAPSAATLQRRWPMLVPLTAAVLVTGFVGFVLNDSGATVPAMMMALATPLAVIPLLTVRAESQR